MLTDTQGLKPPPGLEGDLAVCELRIAAPQKSCFEDKSCQATGFQLALSFDSKSYEYLGIFDTICIDGETCFDLPVGCDANIDGCSPLGLSTGHTVVAFPSNPSSWNEQGGGALVAVDIATGKGALSSASVVDGNVEGDSLVATLWFRRKSEPAEGVDAQNNRVCVYKAAATNANADALTIIERGPSGELITNPWKP
jgi:hypothetical protein